MECRFLVVEGAVRSRPELRNVHNTMMEGRLCILACVLCIVSMIDGRARKMGISLAHSVAQHREGRWVVRTRTSMEALHASKHSFSSQPPNNQAVLSATVTVCMRTVSGKCAPYMIQEPYSNTLAYTQARCLPYIISEIRNCTKPRWVGDWHVGRLCDVSGE